MDKSRRHVLAVIAAAILAPRAALAEATKDAMESLVPAAKRVGQARFRVLLFSIYDAELFAPNAVFDREGAYALRLTYLINAKKDRIISSTVKEMQRQKSASPARIESWVPLMERHFISMDKGTHADFIHTADGRLVLAANGAAIAEITDHEFIAALMDIWLGPGVRDRTFQRDLMGKGN